MKKTIFILIFVMASALSYAAVYESVSVMYPLLDMGAGARAMAMGEAYTAVADDASAVYWNPAGLGTLKNVEVALTYDKWFMDTAFSRFLLAVPLPAGTLGFDAVYMSLGELPVRDIYGNSTGTRNPFLMGGGIGYGYSFGDFSAGASVKAIGQSMGSISSAALAGDAGVLFKAGIFSAGACFNNIGNAPGYSLPMNARAGVAVKIIEAVGHDLLVSADSQYLFKDAFSFSAGAEYVYSGILALRVGYKAGLTRTIIEGFKGLSGGIGINFSNLKIDYAIVPYGELGLTHRVALSYLFGENSEVKPAGAIKEKNQAKQNKKMRK